MKSVLRLSALLPLLILLPAAAPPAIPMQVAQFRLFGSESQNVALSSEGQLLAVLGEREPRSGKCVLDIWNVRQAKKVVTIPKWSAQHSTLGQDLLSFSCSGKTIIAGAYVEDGSTDRFTVDVKVVDSFSGRILTAFPLPSGRGMQGLVCPRDRLLVVTTPSSVAAVHDLATGKEIAELVDPESIGKIGAKSGRSLEEQDRKDRMSAATVRMCISNDGQWLGVASREGRISAWNLATRKRIWRKWGSGNTIESLTFTPDGSLLVSLDSRSSLIVWRSSSGELVRERRIGFRFVDSLADNQTLISHEGMSNVAGFVRYNPTSDRVWGTTWRRPGHRPIPFTRFTLSRDRRWLALIRDPWWVEVWSLGQHWPE